jgi:UDP-N-acetylmuramate dehydrogenase
MAAGEAYERLHGSLDGEVRRDEPMARHTSFRIGGPAAIFAVCDTVKDLGLVTRVLSEESVPFTAVGKGTNLLVADEGYGGAVVTLGRGFMRHTAGDGRVEAGAGTALAFVVQEAFREGLEGLAFAVGIPGTLGGALAMNAGSREEWIGELVESVTVYVPGEGLTRLRGDEVDWGYRTSSLSSEGIIVESVLRVGSGDRARIRAQMDRNFRMRRTTQPVGRACAGSVFKNPPDDSAGRLIESAGLKGARLGGATVSDVHANFIVNEGDATASDVLGLVRRVQETVKEIHGVELRPEIRFLGPPEEAR